jgi:hypothetical protein
MVGVAFLLYIIAVAANAFATEEVDAQPFSNALIISATIAAQNTEGIPENEHVFGYVHNEMGIQPALADFNWARVILHAEISVSELRQASDYTFESWQSFENTLMNAYAVVSRPWSIEAEMEAWANHVRNTRANLVPLERLPQISEAQAIFNHWSLSLGGAKIALLIFIIIAIIWGQK